MTVESPYLSQQECSKTVFISGEIFKNNDFWNDKDQECFSILLNNENNEVVSLDSCCGKLYYKEETIAYFLMQSFGDGGLPIARINLRNDISPEAEQAFQAAINFYGGSLPEEDYSY